ncbi:hypothetical protein ACLOJK_026876 [Asimina triloba]
MPAATSIHPKDQQAPRPPADPRATGQQPPSACRTPFSVHGHAPLADGPDPSASHFLHPKSSIFCHTQLDGRNQPPQIVHANPSTSSAGQHRSQQGSSDRRDRDRAGIPNSIQGSSSPVASAHPVDPDPSTNFIRDPRKAAK